MPKRMRPTTKNVSSKRRSYKRRAVDRRGRSKFGKTGYFKLMRMSNGGLGTDNCHVVIDGSTSGYSGNFGSVFQLNNVQGFAELKSLFDNYRITRVLYRWVMTRDPSASTAPSGLNGQYPRINWVHDFNDSTPISRNQMMQHAGIREFWFTENKQASRWYSLKPSSLSLKYENATQTGYTPKWREWFDTVDDAASHYGIKAYWDQLNTGVKVFLEAKICMEFKGIS